MNGIFKIMKWEIGKVLTDWKRATAVFLVPAAVLMLALNIFPYLINYMSTGRFSDKPVKVVNSPGSFFEYIEGTKGRTVYTHEFLSEDDFMDIPDEDFIKDVKQGSIYVFFDDSEDSVYVGCNGNSQVLSDKADSYIEVVLNPYYDSLTQMYGQTVFNIDIFNPVNKVLNHRTESNARSAGAIPPVIVLLIYYCVYSLMTDMFASERDKGFYNKLLMTPVSSGSIVFGKILSCTLLVTATSYATFFFLFLSSWLNRSNSSSSLIPFGLLLLPGQIAVILIVIPITAFLCASFCLSIIFSIKTMKDVIMNLQMPLIYLLADLFIELISATPGAVEFFIPLHGSTALIKSVMLSEYRPWQLAGFLIASLLPSYLLIRGVFKKEGYGFDNRRKYT